jgi:hypothetical protein
MTRFRPNPNSAQEKGHGVRRQMNEYELGDFYRRIGSAIWHVQYLEDVLVNFLCLKTVHERRCSGQTVSMPDAEALISEKRKVTLGPLIESCTSRKIIQQKNRARFDAFKIERDWLVHRSMIESGDDLYHETTREAVFDRIAAIQEEARSLGSVVFQDLQSWVASHGVDLDSVNNQGANAIRKLKGL